MVIKHYLVITIDLSETTMKWIAKVCRLWLNTLTDPQRLKEEILITSHSQDLVDIVKEMPLTSGL